MEKDKLKEKSDVPDVLIAFDCQVLEISDFQEFEERMVITQSDVIIEINWSAYDCNEKKEIDSDQVFVRPQEFDLLRNKEKELSLMSISLGKDIASGVSLKKALN